MGFPWLRELLGYNEARQNGGAAVATRNILNFIGATVVDNPITGATDISFVAGEAAAREWHVGQGPGMYPTIAAGVAAASADPDLAVDNRGSVVIHPGFYNMSAGGRIDVPSYLSIGGVPGGRGTVQLFNNASDMFRVVGDNVWFHDFLIEGSATSFYAFDCNDKSRVHIERVDMFNNGGVATQRFLTQSGANWSVLKICDCEVDFRGTSDYACHIFNTSGSARLVDLWVEHCFSDAFALTTFGGSFDLSKLRDARFWFNTIRGNNTNTAGVFHNTGVRVRNGGSTGITCEFGPMNALGVEAGSGGRATSGDANTTITLGGGIMRGASSAGTLTNPGNLTYITQ